MKKCAIALVPCLALLASPVAADKWTGRLEHRVTPSFQSVDLRIDPDQSEYTGSTRIEVRIHEELDSFTVHSEGLRIDRAVLRAGDESVVLTVEETHDDAVRLAATRPLSPGDYAVELSFTNEYDTTAVSLYRLDYDGEAYCFTQFEDDDARGAFPCFDEPIFKIPFQLTLRTPVADHAITNTPVESEETADGWRTTVFEKTPPLPTYLIAIAAGPFDFVEIPDFPVPGRVVTPKGRKHLAELAALHAARIMRACEKWFDRPYPYRKMDLLAVPEFWPGAMEHPGAITYRDTVLLLDTDNATPQQLRTLFRFTAHEFAHQWFGNLVTMEWWDDLWLNESFADWMGDRIVNSLYPEMRLLETEMQNTQRVLRADARPSSRAIRRPVSSTDDLLGSVGVTYLKGKLVLSMFERWVGPEAFRQGVLDYLEENAWGNANAADLWRALDGATGRPVARSLAKFLEQPAYPLIRAELQDGNRVRLAQERFCALGVDVPAQTWDVPIVLRYFDGHTVRSKTVLLDEADAVVELEADGPVEWIYPNGLAGGYYRWTLPDGDLATLSAAAPGALEPLERVEFLGNLGALLDAGVVTGDTYMETLLAFAADDRPSVLGAAAAGVTNVLNTFIGTELEDSFAVYVRHLMAPSLDQFGLDPVPGEHLTISAYRPTMLSFLGTCGQDEAVLAHARRLTDAYLEDPAAIDPALVFTLLSLTALEGDDSLWETFRQRFEESDVPSERSRYLSLLGSFEDPALRERALRYTLETELQPQETMTIPFVQSGLGEEEQDRVLDWVMDNHDALTARLPGPSRARLALFGGGCSNERWARAREFFSQDDIQAPGMAARLDRINDQVRECTGLREREIEAVRGFLMEFASRYDAVSAEPRF